MALKPIISIPIDDTKLKAAADHVKRMQEMAAKMPAAWKSLEEATKGTGKASQAIVTAMMAQTSILKDAIEDQHKLTLESDRTAASWRKIETSAKESAKSTHGIIRSVSNWVSRIFRGGGSLLSAVGAEAGIGGLAGLLGGAVIGAVGTYIYGMQRIGQTVGDYRRYAMGLGSTIGQTRAFGLDMGRFINPQQFLGAAAEGMYDYRSPAYRAMAMAGLSPQMMEGGNAVEISEAVLASPRLQSIFRGAPQGAWGNLLESTGLGSFMQGQDVKRWLAHPAEFAKQMAAAKKDQGPLGVADETAKKWVDMTNRLEVAEGGALSAFASGLANAATDLGNTAQAAVNAAMALNGMTSALGGHPAALVAAPIVSAITGKHVTSADVAAQMNAVEGRSAQLRNARKSGKATPLSQLGLTTPPGLTSQVMDDLLGIVRQDETRGRAGMEHAVSPAGAEGLYQIMPKTAKLYGRDPHLLQDVQYNTDTAKLILADLFNRYHGNLDDILAVYHSGRTNRLGPAGLDYLNYAHKLPNWMKVQIELNNAAGYNINESVSALAPGGATVTK